MDVLERRMRSKNDGCDRKTLEEAIESGKKLDKDGEGWPRTNEARGGRRMAENFAGDRRKRKEA